MAFGLAMVVNTVAHAQEKKPNIVFIMGDDIGWFNIGAYHQGIMAGRTPNLDKLAAEGMRFTDYYAEASCTAGRANFITGEIPIRTGLTTVGQAGSPIGMPAEAPNGTFSLFMLLFTLVEPATKEEGLVVTIPTGP
jgi:arylsulfatase